MKFKLSLLFIVFVSACSYQETKKVDAIYFDLPSYFKQEATRLAKKKQAVDKTVRVNGKSETKKLIIENWTQELGSFIDADINKASWRGSFKVTKTDVLETYESASNKIPVKKIEIMLSSEKVSGIRIFITNKNDLYTSSDSLTYYPDSLYEIKKTQKIKLMDGKRYIIRGKFD